MMNSFIKTMAEISEAHAENPNQVKFVDVFFSVSNKNYASVVELAKSFRAIKNVDIEVNVPNRSFFGAYFVIRMKAPVCHIKDFMEMTYTLAKK